MEIPSFKEEPSERKGGELNGISPETSWAPDPVERPETLKERGRQKDWQAYGQQVQFLVKFYINKFRIL